MAQCWRSCFSKGAPLKSSYSCLLPLASWHAGSASQSTESVPDTVRKISHQVNGCAGGCVHPGACQGPRGHRAKALQVIRRRLDFVVMRPKEPVSRSTSICRSPPLATS